MTGTTKSGFKFEVAENIGDDYEIIEMLSGIDESPLILPKLLKHILGDEQLKKMKKHLKEKDGYVSTTSLNKEIVDIISSQNKLKN